MEQEIEKIKEKINSYSTKEFDKVLFECRIESIESSMKEEKYYMIINSPGIFYKSTNEELAFVDTCYQIVDKNIIAWLSKQKFKKYHVYSNKYNTKCLDAVFPFDIQLIKQEEKYVVIEKIERGRWYHGKREIL